MLKKIKHILNLIRIRQFYKNSLVFVGVFFSEKLLDFSLYFSLILGFILLCCASSCNYIINDIIDIEKDKKHLEKLKKKPLASGEISIPFAVILLIVMIGFIAFSLLLLIQNWPFAIMLVLIVITGQLYNFIFKYYAFVDILVLSLGYLWRALAGCVLIDQYVSAWLFLAIFEVALFLVIAKRKGDLLVLEETNNAIEHKKVYNQYSLKLLEFFFVMIAGSVFMTYSLYLIFRFELFSSEDFVLDEYIAILTIPIVIYILMRYMYLTSSKPEIARNTEKAFFDPGIIIAALILATILTYSFYFNEIILLLNNLTGI